MLINPLKLFTIGWHELCHITAVRLLALIPPPSPHFSSPTTAGDPHWRQRRARMH